MAQHELPPPVHVLLAYAADGWAVENWQLTPSGKPRQPKAAHWLPVARSLMAEPNGLDLLRDLALAGMKAWDVDPSIMGCVGPAFVDPELSADLHRRLKLPRQNDPQATADLRIASHPVIGQSTKSSARTRLGAPKHKP